MATCEDRTYLEDSAESLSREMMATCEDRTHLEDSAERIFKLVSKGATSVQWAEWLRAPLEHAVADGDLDLTLSLLKAGANGGAGWKGCDGRTMLQAAAEGGNDKVVSALLDTGGKPELDIVSGDQNMSALHRAIAGGHTAAARVLMVTGADVALLDYRKRSALHYAVEGGHVALVGDLLIARVDLNAKDIDGDTPLHLAAARGDEKLISMLLCRGAGMSAANSRGQHPLHVAIEHSSIAAVEAILKAGADPDVRYGADKIHSPLQLACKSPEMTRMLLRYHASVKGDADLVFPVVHWAASYGDPGVIEALVEAGTDLEAQSGNVLFAGSQFSFSGIKPLHCAAFWRSLATMAVLLRHGADTNATDSKAQTPLHVVCMFSSRTRSAEAADMLLRSGADETLTDNDGRTAKDIIESGTDPTGRLHRLLKNAPTDRTWRRRGMLILSRAYRGKVPGDSSEVGANKVLCRGNGIEANAADGGGDESDLDGVLAWLVALEAEEVFRSIVRFL